MINEKIFINFSCKWLRYYLLVFFSLLLLRYMYLDFGFIFFIELLVNHVCEIRQSLWRGKNIVSRKGSLLGTNVKRKYVVQHRICINSWLHSEIFRILKSRGFSHILIWKIRVLGCFRHHLRLRKLSLLDHTLRHHLLLMHKDLLLLI